MASGGADENGTVKPWAVPVLVVTMVAVIVALDVLLLPGSEWFWPRLVANVTVVAVFGGIDLRFVARR